MLVAQSTSQPHSYGNGRSNLSVMMHGGLGVFAVWLVCDVQCCVSVLLVLWVARECSKELTLHTERSTPAGYVALTSTNHTHRKVLQS